MSAPRERALARETLINWLALAALVALGCLGPGADVPGASAASAASARAPGGALQLAAAPARPD
jgi:hypothetical protein